MLKKGMYMDGHERPNVIEYQKNMFLPLMALYKKNMVQWVVNGSNSAKLMHIDPKLGLDDKRVIMVFQDKSSFHINEYKQTLWCTP
jgi:hypothetical protein